MTPSLKSRALKKIKGVVEAGGSLFWNWNLPELIDTVYGGSAQTELCEALMDVVIRGMVEGQDWTPLMTVAAKYPEFSVVAMQKYSVEVRKGQLPKASKKSLPLGIWEGNCLKCPKCYGKYWTNEYSGKQNMQCTSMTCKILFRVPQC